MGALQGISDRLVAASEVALYKAALESKKHVVKVIGDIKPESRFAKAGVLRGDTITEFEGKKIANLDDLFQKLEEYVTGAVAKPEFELTLQRGESTLESEAHQ